VARGSLGAIIGRSAFFFAFALSAVAADDNKIIYPAGAGSAPAPGLPSGSSVNSITLIIALAIAAIGGWLMWRNRRRGSAAGVAHALAVEETRSLGNRQYLVVASYEGKKFLLGVCPGRIELLAPLSETTPPARPLS
jgi:flagellar protein FliO/FliZ